MKKIVKSEEIFLFRNQDFALCKVNKKWIKTSSIEDVLVHGNVLTVVTRHSQYISKKVTSFC